MTAAFYLPFASVFFLWSGALFGCGFAGGWFIRREYDRGTPL